MRLLKIVKPISSLCLLRVDGLHFVSTVNRKSPPQQIEPTKTSPKINSSFKYFPISKRKLFLPRIRFRLFKPIELKGNQVKTLNCSRSCNPC